MSTYIGCCIGNDHLITIFTISRNSYPSNDREWFRENKSFWSLYLNVYRSILQYRYVSHYGIKWSLGFSYLSACGIDFCHK